MASFTGCRCGTLRDNSDIAVLSPLISKTHNAPSLSTTWQGRPRLRTWRCGKICSNNTRMRQACSWLIKSISRQRGIRPFIQEGLAIRRGTDSNATEIEALLSFSKGREESERTVRRPPRHSAAAHAKVGGIRGIDKIETEGHTNDPGVGRWSIEQSIRWKGYAIRSACGIIRSKLEMLQLFIMIKLLSQLSIHRQLPDNLRQCAIF